VTGLPYPTPTRLRLADAIAANEVKHYHWLSPWSCDIVRDRNVSARVDELVAAGLAEIPPDDGDGWAYVELTDEGRAWINRAKISTEGEGPGSTSPEPGRPCTLADWCVVTGPHDAYGCSLPTSPEPGPPADDVSPEFKAGVKRFLDKNDELMRRLATGPSASPEPGPPAEPHQCPACSPELRCICDPTDPFDPPDPTPRVVAGCPAHAARGAYQRWVTESRRSDDPLLDVPAGHSTEDGAAC
jgi:hypothetical protein